MKRLFFRAILLGACLAVLQCGTVRAAPVSNPVAPANSPPPSIYELIQMLGDVDEAVHHDALEKLLLLPQRRVVDAAVALVDGQVKPPMRDSQVPSTASIALDLVSRIDPVHGMALALKQIDTLDPDVRDVAANVVASQDTAVATAFLVKALGKWGVDNVAGINPLIRGLDLFKRPNDPQVRTALVAVLTLQPAPVVNPRIVYANPHDPPRDGDLYRCWQYKCDGCLTLIARHPFAEADAGVRRCLLMDELRVAAAIALARIQPPDATRLIRTWLDRDRDRARQLGLYRALFMVGGDTEQDRLTARDYFTASSAPSAAWKLGLGAMVSLFEKRADEPALRVVSAWKLRGPAAEMRQGALDAMKNAHPDVYQRVLGPGYVPPVWTEEKK